MEPRLPGQRWEPTHHQFAVLRLQLAQRLRVARTEIRRHLTLRDEKRSHYPTWDSSTQNPNPKSFSAAPREEEEVERMAQGSAASAQKLHP